MHPLPLPTLEQTVDKFLCAIEPVFSAEDVTAAKVAAESLLNTGGPLLQKQLEKYAQYQAEHGKSWLSDDWINGYLTGRPTKALSSNVGFQINFVSENTQFARAAEFIHRMAQTHCEYLTTLIAPPDDGRGNPLSMDGWKVLRGAMRLPKKECDDFYYASNEVHNRHISVFWQQHHYVLPVTDNAGQVLSIQALENALQTLPQQSQPADIPFTLVSALPSDESEIYLKKLCANEHNQQVYQALKDSWFCLSLFSSNTEDEIELLQQQTFMAGCAWQYKPFSYQMDLNSNYISVHVEHTGLDGGALQLILKHALALKNVDTSQAQTSLEPCDWQIQPALAEQIQAMVEKTNEGSDKHQVRQFSIDYSALKMKISHDALIQFSLIYAQLKVFKKLRNTYEAVDTSHFLAGRTECLRPNTNQALNLNQKLLNNQATYEDLQAALDAHRTWVIDCKKGQAIDRHLFALSKQAQGTHEDFFKFVKQFAGADFLSTSTVGTQSPIRRFVFAPTSTHGFGVNYSMGATHYEYCLISNANSLAHLDCMEEAIKEGMEKLIALLIEANI